MNLVYDNRVYIGDVQDAMRLSPEADLAVVSVTSLAPDSDVTSTEYHPLTDGANSMSEFADAVEATIDVIQQYETVLVHCTLGISRSAAVLATAIAVLEDISFIEGLEVVKKGRPNARPANELRNVAEEYLEQR